MTDHDIPICPPGPWRLTFLTPRGILFCYVFSLEITRSPHPQKCPPLGKHKPLTRTFLGGCGPVSVGAHTHTHTHAHTPTHTHTHNALFTPMGSPPPSPWFWGLPPASPPALRHNGRPGESSHNQTVKPEQPAHFWLLDFGCSSLTPFLTRV